jgi:thiamine biosynthesis lipoprotein ApbE
MRNDKKQKADELATFAIEKIHSYEEKFSRFLPNSELSLLNKNKRMTVSKEFYNLYKESYKLFIKTRKYNPPVIRTLLYDP